MDCRDVREICCMELVKLVYVIQHVCKGMKYIENRGHPLKS